MRRRRKKRTKRAARVQQPQCTQAENDYGGVKSQRVKLLSYPIESIERKIALAVLLALIFKILALLTGPALVFCGSLVVCAHLCARNVAFWLANIVSKAQINSTTPNDCWKQRLHFRHQLRQQSSCNRQNEYNKKTSNTTAEGEQEELESEQNSRPHACKLIPLSYLENYWLRKHCVNVCFLKVSGGLQNEHQCIEQVATKLRALIKTRILENESSYVKFQSAISSYGFGWFSALFWRKLDFEETDGNIITSSYSTNMYTKQSCQREIQDIHITTLQNQDSNKEDKHDDADCSEQQFSDTDNDSEYSEVLTIRKELEHEACKKKFSANDCIDRINLSEHVFAEHSVVLNSRRKLRMYAKELVGKPLDMRKPLWQVRVLTCVDSSTVASNEQTGGCFCRENGPCSSTTRNCTANSASSYYMVVRCHQSLADGRTLCNMLGRCCEPTTSDESSDSSLLASPVRRAYFAMRNAAEAARTAFLVGPLTVALWLIWTFSRRKYNHLKPVICDVTETMTSIGSDEHDSNLQTTSKEKFQPNDTMRLYFSHYDLTKLFQIKQLTQSTCCDIIAYALSGAMRDYLRLKCDIYNPPNLNATLAVDSSSIERENELIGATEKPTKQTHVNLSLVNLPLPVGTEGAIPRLWKIRRLMQELRASADAVIFKQLQLFVWSLPIPSKLFRCVINFITLRNSSAFISSFACQPSTLRIEKWCVGLFRTTLAYDLGMRLQQSTIGADFAAAIANFVEQQQRNARANRRRELAKCRIKLSCKLGSITQIHHCMQPPTTDIPLMLSCVSYQDKLFVSCNSRALLVKDSKLLVKLLFKQLNYLSQTIAKRRNFRRLDANCTNRLQTTRELMISPQLYLNGHGSEENDDLLEEIPPLINEVSLNQETRLNRNYLIDSRDEHGRRLSTISLVQQPVSSLFGQTSLVVPATSEPMLPIDGQQVTKFKRPDSQHSEQVSVSSSESSTSSRLANCLTAAVLQSAASMSALWSQQNHTAGNQLRKSTSAATNPGEVADNQLGTNRKRSLLYLKQLSNKTRRLSRSSNMQRPQASSSQTSSVNEQHLCVIEKAKERRKSIAATTIRVPMTETIKKKKTRSRATLNLDNVLSESGQHLSSSRFGISSNSLTSKNSQVSYFDSLVSCYAILFFRSSTLDLCMYPVCKLNFYGYLITSNHLSTTLPKLEGNLNYSIFNTDLESGSNSSSVNNFLLHKDHQHQLMAPLRCIKAKRRFSTIAIQSSNLVPFGLMHNSSLPKLFLLDNSSGNSTAIQTTTTTTTTMTSVSCSSNSSTNCTTNNNYYYSHNTDKETHL